MISSGGMEYETYKKNDFLSLTKKDPTTTVVAELGKALVHQNFKVTPKFYDFYLISPPKLLNTPPKF
jgi:hypothetical protein